MSNCPGGTRASTPRGLSAGSMMHRRSLDPADKPRDVACWWVVTFIMISRA